jgi:hypothetical protein
MSRITRRNIGSRRDRNQAYSTFGARMEAKVLILEWDREGILGVSREIGMTIGKDVDRPNLPLCRIER